MRGLGSWCALVASIAVLAAPVRADDAMPAPVVAASTGRTRALPIALLAVGLPVLAGGVIGIALDEDEVPVVGPTYNDSGPPGVVAVIAGGAFTAAGAYLYLGGSSAATNRPRGAMTWIGVGALGVSAAAGVLGIKYDLDRRQANRDHEAVCNSLTCDQDPELQAIVDRKDRVTIRRDIAFLASGALAIGGIALFLASREGGTGAPQIQVSATSASVGWSRAF